jgi:hypothetical protein
MRDTFIVEQLVTGMRVIPILETIIICHWNAIHSPNEATLLSITGMRVAGLMEHISVNHLGQDRLTQQIIAYADWDVNYLRFHGSVHLKNILIYIQQDATLHSLFYLETALHVSGVNTTHHQERKTAVSTASGICHTVTATCRYSGR